MFYDPSLNCSCLWSPFRSGDLSLLFLGGEREALSFQGQAARLPIAFGIGLLLWFLGGIHDALQSLGMVMLMKDKILWFASFWLSILLTIAIALHYRSLEQAVRETRDVFERFVPPLICVALPRMDCNPSVWGRRINRKLRSSVATSMDLLFIREDFPSQLVSFINQVLERINKVVASHQG